MPTGWVCIIFVVLFGISTCKPLLSLADIMMRPSRILTTCTLVAHLVEAIYFKLWWLLPTAVLAGLGEILGWSARYWSSLNDGILQTPFLIQYVPLSLHCRLCSWSDKCPLLNVRISSTIIAPTPLLAAYFIIVGRLIVILGSQYSRLKPALCTLFS